MDHKACYKRLIHRGQSRPRPAGYVEKHHILPRSLGGDDDPTNLVWLTAREHFIAHRLLAYIHGGKMVYALVMMSRYGRYNSWVYEGLRKIHSEHARARRLGVKVSDETKQKLSEINLGKKLGLETRAKMSARRASETTRAKMSASTLSKISVRQSTRDGEIIAEYASIAQAASELNIFRSSITAAAKGRRPTAGGYVWSYINGE